MDFLYNNFLSDFFVFCMKGFHSFVADYALAIVIFTIVIRLCLFPVDLSQRKNQRKMQALGPQIQSLQKRYKNNPQVMQKKQRELYEKVGYKPAMGCLPMVLQLFILFAFFGAMRVLQAEQTLSYFLDAAQFGPDSVHLTPFFWVHNFWQADSFLGGNADILPSQDSFLSFLSMNQVYIEPQALEMLRTQGLLDFSSGVMRVNADAYNALKQGILEANGYWNAQTDAVTNMNGYLIFPALAGVSLFLQQKFNPIQQQNPMMAAEQTEEQKQAQGCQTKMMMWFMPIFSVYICATGNTAFTLYWIVSSAYAFAQGRIIDAALKKKYGNTEIVKTSES